MARWTLGPRAVFSLSDADGSGWIDASELSGLMARVSGSAPTGDELAAIMRRVDSNGVRAAMCALASCSRALIL